MKTATNQSMLGQILKDSGRIDQKDIDNALRYQREQGGYFGEALLALGLVSREELDWTLASQFDIPYVFPDPESVDRAAASMVTAEWALSHLTLPILRSENTLNVIVHTPMWNAAVEELQQRTGLRIELALAAESKIRELIRHVYQDGPVATPEPNQTEPLGVEQFLAAAVGADASRFGLSSRPGVSIAWYEDSGRVDRNMLVATWRSELERLLVPKPADVVDGRKHGHYDGELVFGGVVLPVRVRFLASGGQPSELVFEPFRTGGSRRGEFTAPPPAVVSEARLLANSGSARFMVTASPADLGPRIIHHLPALLFGTEIRSVAVTGEGRPRIDDVLSQEVPQETPARLRLLEELRAFYFDAVSSDLSGSPEAWLDGVLDIAQTVFALWPAAMDPALAYRAGIRWRLHIVEAEGGHLDWSLSPLET